MRFTLEEPAAVTVEMYEPTGEMVEGIHDAAQQIRIMPGTNPKKSVCRICRFAEPKEPVVAKLWVNVNLGQLVLELEIGKGLATRLIGALSQCIETAEGMDNPSSSSPWLDHLLGEDPGKAPPTE